jgi:hypothetical protein
VHALELAGALGTAWYLLDFMREHHWGPAAGWAWTLGLGLGLFALCAGAGGVAASRRSLALALSLPATGACAAGALAASGSATLGMMCGAWTAALAALALFGRRAGGAAAPLATGAALPALLLYGGLILGGRFASELSTTAALLLALAPLAPGLTLVPPLASRRAGWIGVLLALALAGGALALELALRPEDPYAAYR